MSRTRAPSGGATAGAPPSWLTGEERCPFCLQTYALEMELRCGDCDRAICPCCVTWHERTTVWCPDCIGDECVKGA